MTSARARFLLGLVMAALASCEASRNTAAPLSPALPEIVVAPPAPELPPRREVLTLIAGGDVSLGRYRGQKLLADPSRDDLAMVGALFEPADLRFVNLESIIFDNGWTTGHPDNILVYNAPPAAAPALARAKIDIVSLANNHAWDYGKKGLVETLDRLDAGGIAHVGAGRTRDEAYGFRVVERDGFGVAFIAVTSIWNQSFVLTPARSWSPTPSPSSSWPPSVGPRPPRASTRSWSATTEAKSTAGPPTRRSLRCSAPPSTRARRRHRPPSAHPPTRRPRPRPPHLLQPRQPHLPRHGQGRAWARFGAVARLKFRRDGPTEAWLCPVRMVGHRVIPLAAERDRDAIEQLFRHHYDRLLRAGGRTEPDAPIELGPLDKDGCGRLRSSHRG